MDNLGAVCGVLICILFFTYLGYKNLFLIASIPSLIGVTLILVFIKDRKTVRIFKGISLRDLTPNLKLFLLASAIFALGSFSYSFLLVSAKEIGFEIAFIPVLYLLFTLLASLTSLPFGKIADILGRKHVLILSYIFWGVLCLGFICLKSYLGVLLLFGLYGLHKGAMEPTQRTFVSELSPIEYRASMFGAFQLIVGWCALPASSVAGVLWVIFGKAAPFYFSLVLTGLTVVLMLFVNESPVNLE